MAVGRCLLRVYNLFSMMRDYFKSFPYRLQHRREELDAADAVIASAEFIPKIILLFILLVLPFLVSPTSFDSLGDFLWWVKAWAPVWAAMAVILYLPAFLALAPAQLTGAAVEAMIQAEDNKEPVAWREPVVEECILAAPFWQVDEQITRVQSRLCLWRRLHWRPPRKLHFPHLHYIPHPASKDTSD